MRDLIAANDISEGEHVRSDGLYAIGTRNYSSLMTDDGNAFAWCPMHKGETVTIERDPGGVLVAVPTPKLEEWRESIHARVAGLPRMSREEEGKARKARGRLAANPGRACDSCPFADGCKEWAVSFGCFKTDAEIALGEKKREAVTCSSDKYAVLGGPGFDWTQAAKVSVSYETSKQTVKHDPPPGHCRHHDKDVRVDGHGYRISAKDFKPFGCSGENTSRDVIALMDREAARLQSMALARLSSLPLCEKTDKPLRLEWHKHGGTWVLTYSCWDCVEAARPLFEDSDNDNLTTLTFT